MDSFINDQIVQKTVNIFKKLFHVEVTAGDIYIREHEDHDWDISGVVGVVGNLEGVISIRLKNSFGSVLLEKSRLNSNEASKQWSLLNDMVCEIINNIVGNVLGEVSDKKSRNSVPFTIQGDNHILQWPDNSPIVVIPFSLDKGSFEVQYSLLEKKS